MSKNTYSPLFLIEMGYGNKQSKPHVGKVTFFKSQVGNVNSGLTTSGFPVITPIY